MKCGIDVHRHDSADREVCRRVAETARSQCHDLPGALKVSLERHEVSAAQLHKSDLNKPPLHLTHIGDHQMSDSDQNAIIEMSF